MQSRRNFIKSTGSLVALGLAGITVNGCAKPQKELPFDISLAEWSLHNTLFAKEIDHLDFAKIAKEKYGLTGVEYVNQFFFDKAKDQKYLQEMKMRADDLGVKSVLIMCDSEGSLGDPDEAKRKTAIENHYKWVEAAKFLGCHSIRVNAYSAGSYEEQQNLVVDGLTRLAAFSKDFGINIIVENHGGLSSNGKWLVEVMKKANNPLIGTLPDFGNFNLGEGKEYDRYLGVEEMMLFAKGVSAKSQNFDEAGNETNTDFVKMMKIVLDAGYHGYVDVEYSGPKETEYDGIQKTVDLLRKIQQG